MKDDTPHSVPTNWLMKPTDLINSSARAAVIDERRCTPR
jgi:hypothetical protein